MKWWLGLPIAAVAVFLAIGAVIRNTPEGKERTKQREVIALCWDGQAKKSNEPGTARVIAGACERMEADYVKRWGTKP